MIYVDLHFPINFHYAFQHVSLGSKMTLNTFIFKSIFPSLVCKLGTFISPTQFPLKRYLNGQVTLNYSLTTFRVAIFEVEGNVC